MNRNLKRTCVAHIQRLLICTCIFTLFATIGKASHVQENTETGNYILILNSYNESSPWSNSITTPIVHKIAGIENMDAYIEHLNLFMVGDSTKIERFPEILSSKYGSTPPRLLVFIGSMSLIFNLYGVKYLPLYAEPTPMCTMRNSTGREIQSPPKKRHT